MKPTGVHLTLRNGYPSLAVSTPNRAIDAIWDAVREARLAGLSVQQFRSEAAEAWEHDIRDEIKSTRAEWAKR